MALVIKDRVKETTTTTGTGTVTLGGALSGFQSFSAIGDGNTTYYAIVDSNNGDWEVGLGTYTASGTTLSRDTILSSSNSGSAVSLASGTKSVYSTYPASKAAFSDDIPTNNNELTNGAGYITGNQSISLTGDATGTGTTSITVSLAANSVGSNEIATDAVGSSEIAANAVGASELNVTGNGTTSQFLRSDGDGTFTWATPPDTTANQTITLSGDASGSGTTSISVSLAADSVGSSEIAANAVSASELNVSGNGSTSQFLRSDGDGSFTWATPTDTNTTYSAGTGVTLTGTTFSIGQAVSTTSNPTFNDVYIADQIIHQGDSDTYMQFHASDQWRVVTGGTERLEVNNSAVTIPGVLNVRNAIDLADNDFVRFGSGDDCEFFCNGSHMYIDLNSGIGNLYIRDGTTTRYTFDDNGSFTATGNVTAYSDIRLKENIEVIDDALGKVKQLRGVTFDRIDEDDLGRQTGLIAQEVEEVLPEAVITLEDEMQTKSVAYGNMVGLLVEAVKELSARIEELESR